MFDKMIFKAVLTEAEQQRVIDSLHLVRCSRDGKFFWSDSEYKRLSGMECTIRDRRMRFSTSVHKLYQQNLDNRLDNSRPCCLSDAITVIMALWQSLEIPPDKVKVSYFEIGLSFPMSHEPIDYIRQMLSVGCGRSKEMFHDFHFEKNREKVTEKTKFVRKVMKVYDKTFESGEKGRMCDPNIIRVETQYKRLNVALPELLSPDSIGRYISTFYNDWSSVTWVRSVTSAKGVKESQTAKAREILALGVDGYLSRHRQEWKAGVISNKNWRVYREFASSWPQLSRLFTLERGPLEAEYDDKFHLAFTDGQR